MRFRGYRSSLLAAALVTIGAGREAAAFDVWFETVDWVPTSSVVSAPLIPTTSYLAPTVHATTYLDGPALAPTSYVATGGYAVPTYYETRFRRSLFGRRLIPTGTRAVYATSYATSYFPTTLYYPSAYVVPSTYIAPTTYLTPTTYLAPTVVDRGLVATAYSISSDVCCGDAVIAPTTSARTVVVEPAPSRAEPSRPAPRARIEADRDEGPALSSEVEDLPSPAPAPAPRSRPAPVQSTPGAVAPAPADAEESPPTPRSIEREKSTAPPAETAPAPVAPADDLLPAPGDGLGMNTGRREVRRPSTYDVVDRARRNVLFGRVRERDSGESEEGVRVTITNRAGAFADRSTMSDAFGRFAVRLPDGDWTVRVAMPSGRTYAVSEITVSDGLITDSDGRDVPSLTITR